MMKILILVFFLTITVSCSNMVTFTKNQPQKIRVLRESYNPSDRVWRPSDLDMNGCFNNSEIDERGVATISSFDENRVASLFFTEKSNFTVIITDIGRLKQLHYKDIENFSVRLEKKYCFKHHWWYGDSPMVSIRVAR